MRPNRPVIERLARHFVRVYATADPRSLAAGRIALALVLLVDLGRRVSSITTWYTNDGLLPNPTVLAAHELQEGRTYYILMTTAYGLYRYNIFDVVRCTGYFNQTPLVEFLSKGALFSNLTGEKISEHHVT